LAVISTMVDDLPISVGLQSLPDRRFILVNKAFEVILSTPRDMMIGRTLQEILPGRDLSDSFELERAALDSGRVEARQVRIIDPSTGEDGAVELRKVAIDVDGARYMLTTSENVSALIRSQRALNAAVDEARRANDAKSLFLATMSHEIRTPLNGVLGMAQAMSNGPLSAVQRERLSIIRQSGEALLAILNDILDLSKIEAGKLEIETIEFDLAELIRGAHATFTALANKKQLSFELDCEAAAGVYRGDPARIRQIVYNLCSNALKFTEAGHIGLRAVHRDGWLHLSVFDTGIGIEPHVLANLFSNFVQADASTTRRFGGTGLGLAICRKLAVLMGGDVSASSSPGEGSIFVLEIPLERVVNGVAAPARSDDHPSGDLTPPGLRVLAAEDNSVNQLVLKTLLHQAGVEPHVVGDGLQAVEAWEREAWDVILMDIQMPIMDGPTATQKIRSREVELGRPRTPIIALTANAMSGQVAEYLANGMDACVTKPIEVAALFDTLARVLDEASSAV
jgi:PAS domain S-box-containing protein